MLYKTKKYYDFLEIFQEEDDCPICIMLKRWREAFIETFFYECVNDRTMRKRIRETGGFCKVHAKAMLDEGDPLGHSVIYTALIDEYLKNPNAKKKKGCLLCDLEDEQEIITLKAFLDFFRESEEFVKEFSNKGICVCRPHLLKLKELTKKDKVLIKKLDSVQETNLKVAKESIDEIIRKHDYRYKNEQLTETENKAWKRAVKIMSGITD